MELTFNQIEFNKIKNTIEHKKEYYNFFIEKTTEEVMFLIIEKNKARVIFLERGDLYYNNKGELQIIAGENKFELLNRNNVNIILNKVITAKMDIREDDLKKVQAVLKKIVDKLTS